MSPYQGRKLVFRVNRARRESGRIGLDFGRRFLDPFVGGRVETCLRYPRKAREAEAGAGHEIRTWITVAGAAGGARGPVLTYQPAPPRSIGCVVAAQDVG